MSLKINCGGSQVIMYKSKLKIMNVEVCVDKNRTLFLLLKECSLLCWNFYFIFSKV